MRGDLASEPLTLEVVESALNDDDAVAVHAALAAVLPEMQQAIGANYLTTCAGLVYAAGTIAAGLGLTDEQTDALTDVMAGYFRQQAKSVNAIRRAESN